MKSEVVLLGLVAALVAIAVAFHRHLAALRRAEGRMPPAALEAQRCLVWLPAVWLLALGTMVVEARVLSGEWPSPTRPLPWSPRPSWPDPEFFAPLSIFLVSVGLASILSWFFFIPLAWHARRERATPKLAGMPTFLALQAVIWTYWILNPGGFTSWALIGVFD